MGQNLIVTNQESPGGRRFTGKRGNECRVFKGSSAGRRKLVGLKLVLTADKQSDGKWHKIISLSTDIDKIIIVFFVFLKFDIFVARRERDINIIVGS